MLVSWHRGVKRPGSRRERSTAKLVGAAISAALLFSVAGCTTSSEGDSGQATSSSTRTDTAQVGKARSDYIAMANKVCRRDAVRSPKTSTRHVGSVSITPSATDPYKELKALPRPAAIRNELDSLFARIDHEIQVTHDAIDRAATQPNPDLVVVEEARRGVLAMRRELTNYGLTECSRSIG